MISRLFKNSFYITNRSFDERMLKKNRENFQMKLGERLL